MSAQLQPLPPQPGREQYETDQRIAERLQAEGRVPMSNASAETAVAWMLGTHTPRPPKTEVEQATDFLQADARRLDRQIELQKLKQGVDLTPGDLVLRDASTVQVESVWWLWHGYIAFKFLNLVAGETAAGKSTVLTDIVARVTTGAPMPGEQGSRPPGRVLWLGSEDPMEVLTVPRLMACGADLRNVTEIQAVTRMGKRDTFSMQSDIAQVRNTITWARDTERRPFAALVIDPITSYLHGGKLRKVDMNDSGQLRTILEPWTVLAAETGLAIIAVTHLAKDTTRSMLHRVLGGGAFAQLCRSLLAVVSLPNGAEYAKAVMQVKRNLPGVVNGAWRFHTDRKVVAYDRQGREVDATFPCWEQHDPSLTPEVLAGGQRGPVGKSRMSFGLWLRTFFVTTPAGQGRPVAEVRDAAIAAGVATERWFTDHSYEYLEKQNVAGTWMCRPIGH